MGCEDIVGKLRPGDVYCHMYAGRKETILDSDGRVRCLIKKARERGVIFDACNGRGNFLFSVAKPCMNQGFWPDIISTDGSSLVQYRQPVISLPRLLSKYLALGMPLEAVLDAATIAPARWLGREDLASMQAGTPADITIWKLKEKHLSYTDVAGDICTGSQVLVPQMTIRNGIIEYCQSDFQ